MPTITLQCLLFRGSYSENETGVQFVLVMDRRITIYRSLGLILALAIGADTSHWLTTAIGVGTSLSLTAQCLAIGIGLPVMFCSGYASELHLALAGI